MDALRDGGFIRLSLVAHCDGAVVGHILVSEWPILADAEAIPALALAPIAVLQDVQRQGIGSEPIRRGLDLCREDGRQIVIVIGHPEFYPRFGFSAEQARPLASPFSGKAWMAIELRKGALEGVVGRVAYPPPCGIS